MPRGTAVTRMTPSSEENVERYSGVITGRGYAGGSGWYTDSVLFLFQSRSQPYGRPSVPPFGPMLLGIGLLCILTGLAIIAAPELLAYIVAGLLIFIGVSTLGAWWRMRR